MAEISYKGYTTHSGTVLRLRQPYHFVWSAHIYAALMNEPVLRLTRPKDVSNDI